MVAGLAGLALWTGAPAVREWLRPPFVFDPLPVPGFRALSRPSPGLTAIALAPVIPGVRHSSGLADRELCAALHAPGKRPALAYFLDPQCPICRQMLPEVIGAATASGAPLRIHLLTGLGPASEVAARAILAARAQGLEAAMRDRLARAALVPDMSYVLAVAGSVGAEPGRLAADMDSETVTAELGRAADLARIFGLRGTPATFVGHTLAEGRLGRGEIEALIRQEAGESPGPCS